LTPLASNTVTQQTRVSFSPIHPSIPPTPPTQRYRSEHTLAVTAVAIGLGEVNATAVTASLDRSVKIWQLATGALLRAVTLPAGATAVALDAGEQALYVGCADGSICEVPLAGSSGAAAAAAASAGPGGPQLPPGVSAVMEGHSKAVSSLSLSLDGDSLVSGSEDGSVRIWDLRSRQCTRSIPSPGRAPVTAALVIEWPDYLAGVGAATAGSSGRAGPKRPAPLAPLAKFEGAGGGAGAGAADKAGAPRGWEGAPLVLDGCCPVVGVAELPGLLQPAGAALAAAAASGGDGVWGAQLVGGAGGGGERPAAAAAAAGGGGGEAPEVADLKRQLAEAQAAAERWKQLHGELHAFCTEQVLEGAKS
jgi:pre-rRNA-processing protein IPI3